jgi:hypothetical protein
MTISTFDRNEFNARSSLSGKFGLNLTARASPREVRLLAVIELEPCKMESIVCLVVAYYKHQPEDTKSSVPENDGQIREDRSCHHDPERNQLI